MLQGIWEVLGIPPTEDIRAIKRAYAAKLKSYQPEDDPEGFRRLHAAYEAALNRAQAQLRPAPFMPPPPPPETLPDLPRRAGRQPPTDPLRWREDPGKNESQSSSRPDVVEPATEPPAFEPDSAAAPQVMPSPHDEAREIILTLFRSGAAAALAALDELLALPRYQSLLNREQFQRGILERLPRNTTTEPFPAEFLSALAERFGWHEGRHPFQRLFPREFQVIRRARDEHLAHKLLHDYAAGKSRGMNLLHRFLYRRAARLLLGRTPKLVYRVFSIDPTLKRYAGLIVRRIHQAYPLASDGIYDPAALSWCRSQLGASGGAARVILYALLLLNVLAGMVIGFLVEDGIAKFPVVWVRPEVFHVLVQLAAFLFVAVPLQALAANTTYWCETQPRFKDAKYRRRAFWLTVLALYLLIAVPPLQYGLYFWGVAAAFFLTAMPDFRLLALTLFIGGGVWGVITVAFGPTDQQTAAHPLWRLDSPFLGWVFMIAVWQLYQRVAPARHRVNYLSYLALVVAATLGIALALALLQTLVK